MGVKAFHRCTTTGTNSLVPARVFHTMPGNSLSKPRFGIRWIYACNQIVSLQSANVRCKTLKREA